MKNNHKSHSWAIIFVFLFLVFAIPATAQIDPNPCVETFAFDFNDTYYANNGVNAEAIVGRRTGYDKLSVFNKTCDPRYAPVRVLVTVAVYDHSGQPVFWTPLGDIDYAGFTPDKRGFAARQMALETPIYIFPDRTNWPNWQFSAFEGARQAPVMESSPRMGPANRNVLGLRNTLIVNYTEKAFNTKEGVKIMAYFAEKNGLAADDTPILKTVDDIRYMLKGGFITAEPYTQGDMPAKEIYTIAPAITKAEAVAPDAFIWMTLKNGQPLPAEEIFMRHFECIKKIRDWCNTETLD